MEIIYGKEEKRSRYKIKIQRKKTVKNGKEKQKKETRFQTRQIY